MFVLDFFVDSLARSVDSKYQKDGLSTVRARGRALGRGGRLGDAFDDPVAVHAELVPGLHRTPARGEERVEALPDRGTDAPVPELGVVVDRVLHVAPTLSDTAGQHLVDMGEGIALARVSLATDDRFDVLFRHANAPGCRVHR